MSMVVDLRRGRIGSARARQSEPDEEETLSLPCVGLASDGAEIILFPKVNAARTNRPRKRLTRRFASRARKAAREQQ